jgi:hypothetical protein
VTAETRLQVDPPSTPAGPVLPAERVVVRKAPVDWPEGTLTPYAEKLAKAEVSIAAPRGVQMRTKDHEQHRSITASFNLRNPLIDYAIRYQACNDTAAHHEEDARRAWSIYGMGTGFTRPNPNSWYYNSYLNILIDGMPVGEYILSDLKEESADKDGKVVMTWDTPKGKVDLSFVLMHDHMGVFQELKIRDAVAPIQTLSLSFVSYYWGLKAEDKQADGFVTVDPSGDNAWALMGNRINEPAYGKGSGACAIRILPEEFDSVQYGYPIKMERTVNLEPGQSASVHWVLWTFPEFSNAKAMEYMNSDSASGDSRERLRKLFELSR